MKGAHFQAKYIKLNLISDTFRFQEQSSDKAAPPDSEEEWAQEDEGCDGVESSDEEEGKMQLSIVSESRRCKRIF